MTVIAWDGKTLAADRMMHTQGYCVPYTKIRRIRGMLVGGAGNSAHVNEMLYWLEAGCDPDKFPDFQRVQDEFVDILCITKDGQIHHYNRGPIPMRIEAKHFAIGSGAEVAQTAMHLGCTAAEAVSTAIELAPNNCGLGVDTLTLKQEE